jgi:hypothetical protein
MAGRQSDSETIGLANLLMLRKLAIGCRQRSSTQSSFPYLVLSVIPKVWGFVIPPPHLTYLT